MKDIQDTNALLENRDQSDMLISTELLISALFQNTRNQLSETQMDTIGHAGERAIVRHQLQMMLSLSVDGSDDMLAQYFGEI